MSMTAINHRYFPKKRAWKSPVRRALRLCVWLLGLALMTDPAGARAASLERIVSPSGESVGLNMLWWPGDKKTIEDRLQKARALGVDRVRIDWEWRLVETQRGVYNWALMDELVELAGQHRIELLPIVHYAPDWALQNTRKASGVYQLGLPIAAHEAYADFVRLCIERYGPRDIPLTGKNGAPLPPIRHWQIWNEPNVKEFWGNKPDPAAFANLVYCVHKKTKDLREQGGVKLVHAGIAKADVPFLKSLYTWAAGPEREKWAARGPALDANIPYGDTFEIMAVNQYTYGVKGGKIVLRTLDEVGRPSSREKGRFIGSLKDPNYMPQVFNIQRVMTDNGEDKPIWMTEVGYIQSAKAPGVSEARQAELLRETVAFIRERFGAAPVFDPENKLGVNIQRIYWFALEDYPSPDGLGNFGLYTDQGRLREAGKALKDINTVGSGQP